MKKRLSVLLILSLLLSFPPLCALGLGDALFPAYGDNGLAGYINRFGEWVIPPRFDFAGEFRGDYAVVGMYPEDWEEDRFWDYDAEGVIDRTGDWVLPPEYSIDSGYDGQYYGGKDTGIWYVWKREDVIWGEDEEGEEILLSDSLAGFFDIPSGHFSGLRWYGIWPWCSDSVLIPVIDEGGAGYAHRATGEVVIPCRYFDCDPGNFHEGVASVAYMDEEGNPGDFFLIDETGAEIPLPAGIHARYQSVASEGRIDIQNEDGLLGFADLEGNVVIPPQFTYVHGFSGGQAVVQFQEGDWGLIDREGNVIARGLQADHWSGPRVQNGQYVKQTGEQEFSLRTIQGDPVFTLTMENLVSLSLPMENGLCWFETDVSGRANAWMDRKWGLTDLSGRVVSEAQWKLPDFEPHDFPEGLQLVVQAADGQRKCGFIDETGAVAIPLIYDDAASFENGLTWVRLGDQCGYIDRHGQWVFSWEDADWE